MPINKNKIQDQFLDRLALPEIRKYNLRVNQSRFLDLIVLSIIEIKKDKKNLREGLIHALRVQLPIKSSQLS